MTLLANPTPPSHQDAAGFSIDHSLEGIAKQAALERMYPKAAPPALQPARSAEVQVIRQAAAAENVAYPAHKAYGTEMGSNNVRVGVVYGLALALQPMASQAQLDNDVPELAQIARDAGMGANDISMLASTVNRLRANPPTDLQVEAGRLEAVAAIRHLYSLTDGPGGFDRAMKDATQLAQRDPLLASILKNTGAGNDPRVIVRFAELGREARRRGELK